MPFTSKTFAIVLALHVGLLWLAQAVWTSEPAKVVREVVAAEDGLPIEIAVPQAAVASVEPVLN